MATNAIKVKCFNPGCGRTFVVAETTHKKECPKCLEVNIIKNGKAIRSYPKDLDYTGRK